MSTINLGEALKKLNESRGKAAAPGVYDVEVTKAEARTTTKGKLMFVITTKVLTGENANDTIPFNVVYTPAEENPGAAYYFFQKMQGLGADEALLTEHGDNPEHVAKLITGNRVRITVTEGKDPKYTNVDDVLLLGRGSGSTGAPAVAPPVTEDDVDLWDPDEEPF